MKPVASSVSDHKSLLTECRKVLKQERQALHERYLQRPKPDRMLRAQTKLVDTVLRKIWRALNPPKDATLAAVGGYGRGELYPCSDIDVLILLAQHDEPSEAFAEQLVGLLWDIGLEIGHSVRTIDETLEEAAKDLTVLTNLAEGRALVDPQKKFEVLKQGLIAQISRKEFISGKVEEQRQRYLRHNDTAFNLEPNVKESPGGLRDLQTLIWLAWGAGIGSDWGALVAHGIINDDELRRVKRDQRILQDLRIRLHLLAGRREDRLLFDYQHGLAQQFGFKDEGTHRASEFLMQRFFKTAKSVELLNTILTSQIRNWQPTPIQQKGYEFDAHFARWNKLLGNLQEDAFEQDPSLIFKALIAYQQHPELKGFTPTALRSLWRARRLIDRSFRASAVNQALFMQILREPRRVTDVLRRMNRYGLLGKYIPAFGRIEGQMQHDLFHVYTVDEHILRVLRNVRRFAVPQFDHEFPLCSELMQSFERPEVLYLAALFHDIAKGRGGDHSTLGSVDARQFCKQHGLLPEDIDLVVWLVEQHLQMSSTAQKQDLSDPDVIQAFTSKVGSERYLIALYLLTVADVRGTSPKVWNAWKGKLLEDLFRSTRRQLQGRAGSLSEVLEIKRQKAAKILTQYGLEPARYAAFWSRLDELYFQRHEVQEIAWHTRSLCDRHSNKNPIVRARLSPLGEGLQVLIYSADEVALFARICSFFEQQSFSIELAKIHTTKDGYALDSFQVNQRDQTGAHYRDVLAHIEKTLVAELSNSKELLKPRVGRISRHAKHFPIPAKAGLSAPDRTGVRVLTLSAHDQPGLLYRVARVLLNNKIALHGAKINTLGELAEDSLLISGQDLDSPESEQRLKEELISVLSVA
jgi:[protein-PII] uridylyltransferase